MYYARIQYFKEQFLSQSWKNQHLDDIAREHKQKLTQHIIRPQRFVRLSDLKNIYL